MTDELTYEELVQRITELEKNARQQSEEFIRERDQKFIRFAENSLDMIYRMSLPDGKYEYVSPASTTIFGYSPKEWYDNPLLIRRIIHKDFNWYFEQQWEDLLKGTIPSTYEYKIRHKEGKVRWVNQRTVLVKDDDGQPVALEGIVTDITERKQAEEALKDSLAEKEVLLREVHHRVKNNMAAIIGLFSLHRQAMEDPQSQAVLSELSSRVRAMSLVHEKLYRSESLAKIDFQDYIQSLISHLRTSFGSPGISCDIQASGVEMPLDLAVPCGMIINELITNALKYAFPKKELTPGKGSDRIEVAMSNDNGTFFLSIADNGVGLPAGFDLKTVKSLGLVLVKMLGQHQLGGRYEIDHRNGTRFTLTFSLRKGGSANG